MSRELELRSPVREAYGIYRGANAAVRFLAAMVMVICAGSAQAAAKKVCDLILGDGLSNAAGCDANPSELPAHEGDKEVMSAAELVEYEKRNEIQSS